MKKKRHEEHESHERWLVSYADFITLLFAFFTVMYAISTQDNGKLLAVVQSVNEAFNVGIVGAFWGGRADGKAPPSVLRPLRISSAGLTHPTLRTLAQDLAGSLSNHAVQVGFVEQDLEIQLPARVLFAPGSTALHPSAYGILSGIAAAVADMPIDVEVTGHADGLPVDPESALVDNWGVATGRAVATVRFLEDRGVSGARLRVAAMVATTVAEEERAVTMRLHIEDPGWVPGVTHDVGHALEEAAAPGP